MGDPPAAAPHRRPDGRFRNPWPGSLEIGVGRILRWTAQRVRERRFGVRARGAVPLPVTPEPPPIRVTLDDCRVSWIGHSSFLLQTGGLNILTDPMFSERASPVSFAGPRRLVPPGLALEALPPIDLVLQSHNHYDHFDAPSIRALARRSASTVWCAPLGVGRRLRALGVERIVECDWHQSAEPIPGARVVCEPARHFSGRGLADRNATLWCGWTLVAGSRRIYFVGDSAYHPDFAEIGVRDGPFDAVLMPIGAYDPRWIMSPVHMDPEEAVSAFVATRAGNPSHASVMVAMHWGTFTLTDEPVDEPPARARAEWTRRQLDPSALWILAPGETRVLGSGAPETRR